MKICISAGHSKDVRGAAGPSPWGLEEVEEARRVTKRVSELLNAGGVPTEFYWDDVSQTQDENLRRICDWHNSRPAHDIDCSIHFNAYQVTTTKPMGVEVFYGSDQALAKRICDAIVAACGLPNRGAKSGSGLYFITHTAMPAVLCEMCFVDAKIDCDTFRRAFEPMCLGLAEGLAGRELGSEPVPPEPEVPAGPPARPGHDEAICAIAMQSEIASYSWKDRGPAPPAYIKGFALAWAQVVQGYYAHDAAVLAMAVGDKKNSEIDALSAYAEQYRGLGMSNAQPGMATLRHLYALLLGLGMRESSGKHCCGRDQSAGSSSQSADTCEAGLYQTSYNAHTCHPTFDPLMQEYEHGQRKGYVETFSAGVTCSSADWSNYGSGKGAEFQRMCKTLPAFAVESCALVLRNRCTHYGPIKRLEAELREDSDELLLAVQRYVEHSELIA